MKELFTKLKEGLANLKNWLDKIVTDIEWAVMPTWIMWTSKDKYKLSHYRLINGYDLKHMYLRNGTPVLRSYNQGWEASESESDNCVVEGFSRSLTDVYSARGYNFVLCGGSRITTIKEYKNGDAPTHNFFLAKRKDEDEVLVCIPREIVSSPEGLMNRMISNMKINSEFTIQSINTFCYIYPMEKTHAGYLTFGRQVYDEWGSNDGLVIYPKAGDDLWDKLTR